MCHPPWYLQLILGNSAATLVSLTWILQKCTGNGVSREMLSRPPTFHDGGVGLATVSGRAMPPEDDALSHGVCVGSRPMDEVVPTSSAHVHLKTAKMGDDVPLGVMSPHHASKGTDCAKIARGQKQVSDSLGGSFEVVSELAHGHDNALLKARRTWKCLEVRLLLKVPLACSAKACQVHCGAESP